MQWNTHCRISHGKTGKQIELPFRVVSGLGLRNCALDGHAHWRHLANTVERMYAGTMSGSTTGAGNAACSQITFGKFCCCSNTSKSYQLFIKRLRHWFHYDFLWLYHFRLNSADLNSRQILRTSVQMHEQPDRKYTG